MSDISGDKYYKLEKKRQEDFRRSEKNLNKKYQEAIAKEREQDALNRLHPEDSTAELEFAKGGLVSRGQGKVKKIKITKSY
jgi:hypothetical protein